MYICKPAKHIRRGVLRINISFSGKVKYPAKEMFLHSVKRGLTEKNKKKPQ